MVCILHVTAEKSIKAKISKITDGDKKYILFSIVTK